MDVRKWGVDNHGCKKVQRSEGLAYVTAPVYEVIFYGPFGWYRNKPRPTLALIHRHRALVTFCCSMEVTREEWVAMGVISGEW